MSGRTIYADVELEEDEDLDFTGWVIVDRGRRIGICTGLEDIPGNPCLEVRIEGSSKSAGVLIPLHEDFIVEVDENSRTLSLDLPDGLY